MKKRFLYLGLFFATALLLFIFQKPLFMLYNDSVGRGVPLAEYFRVMWHGASLDAAVTGYLIALPWLVTLISVWFKKFPLRKILTGYYALIALLISLIFMGDMSLYPFWNFKLDASVFFYLESPQNAMASVSAGFVILRILCILLLSGLTTWILYRITPRMLPAVAKKLWGSFELILTGGIIFLVIRGGVT
ncbi:LTA synthase family protein, partial [Bacteroides gallinaceum]|nr:LTA synthase family protein [Bacteroides gallinaceum]